MRQNLIFFIFVTLFFAAGTPPMGEKSVAKKKIPYSRNDVLAWFAQARKEAKIISGQHTRVGDAASYKHFPNSVREVHEKTMPQTWVGIYSTDIGIFLSGIHDQKPLWYKEEDLFHTLVDWAVQGGLVEFVSHQVSPEEGDYKGKMSSLSVLLNPKENPAVYGKFWKRMDDMAAFFKRLQKAGVPILWRPLHEMNGDWFWWGDRGSKDWSRHYAALWKKMHRHFTVTHQLDNLLWVYSPDGQTKPENALKGWPGDEFVDVVGIDFYNKFSLPEKRKLALTAWNLLKTKKKPMGITELGPFVWGTEKQNQAGSYDYVQDFLEPVRKHLPEAVFFIPWYDPWIPTRNPGFQKLYQHPSVWNRDVLQKKARKL